MFILISVVNSLLKQLYLQPQVIGIKKQQQNDLI